MPNLRGSSECTGCMACANVCQKHAIRFVQDEMGALIPAVDKNSCVNCGACERSCQQLYKPDFHAIQKAYALYTKNHGDRLNCASGGAATTVSRWFIEHNGYVCGTSFDNNGKPVFELTNQSNMLNVFRGSKYVYCEPGQIYRAIKKRIDSGSSVLFIGTPCQVDACKRVIGETPLLYTMGLICHGTPPYAYLKDHLKACLKEKNLHAATVSFRGVNDFMLCAYDDSGRILFKRRQAEDTYFLAFMQGLIYREKCYTCQYAQPDRVEDITIGDFWGLERGALHGYAGKVSVALCNTQKGMELFDRVKELFVYEERQVSEAIQGNSQLRFPTIRTFERDIFCKAYISHNDFSYAICKTRVPFKTVKSRFRRYALAIPKALLRNISKERQ